VNAFAATLLEPTLSDSVDSLLALSRGGALPHCLWCGSRQVLVAQAPAGERDMACSTVIGCRECGSELVSSPHLVCHEWRP